MGYGEKRGSYYRGRYKVERGRYDTVKDSAGETVRFRTKRDAENAANDVEAKIREGRWKRTISGLTFGDFASRWYETQDLAASTMQNYRRHIEEHLLPTFEQTPVAEISQAGIAAWVKSEKAAGYADSSVRTWRATLHLILADAFDEGLIEANPASRRRGRGKRSGKTSHRGPEKAVTDALGVLLIAERAALLAGRDDEFVGVVTAGFTGIRWGELVGLQTEYVRPGRIRVEWQLYELDTGELHRCPPKDDSRRTIDIPAWLEILIRNHLSRTQPSPCDCHGLRYVFRGHRPANGALRTTGPRLADVARRAEVSTGTVSNVLNRPQTVPVATRTRVEQAVADLGYIHGAPSGGELAPHWRRNGFATWLFRPAATGWYPPKAPQEAHPVPILSTPLPGVPVRGRGAHNRADASWLPIAPGLTPHGLRHSHKTMMDGLDTPVKLKDERMGHEDGSVQARYSHVTPDMRQRLLDGLTQLWCEALGRRRRMSSRSPVAALDALLRER